MKAFNDAGYIEGTKYRSKSRQTILGLSLFN